MDFSLENEHIKKPWSVETTAFEMPTVGFSLRSKDGLALCELK